MSVHICRYSRKCHGAVVRRVARHVVRRVVVVVRQELVTKEVEREVRLRTHAVAKAAEASRAAGLPSMAAS